MAKKFTDEEIEQIKSKYNSGMKFSEIADKHNRRSCSIIGLLKRIGVFKNCNNRWTKDEKELLINIYQTSTKDEIVSYFPNRTLEDIYAKASKLGLKREKWFWSNEDVEILKNNYGLYTAKEIQPMLSEEYSVVAIKTKAMKLGLSCIKRWTAEEEEILRKNYSNVAMDEIVKMLPDRTVNSIQIHARKLGLVANFTIENYYSEEQRNFIRDNWETMTDSEMAQNLGKCVSGVMEQRRKMGFYHLNKEYTDYNDFSKLLRGQIGTWKTDSMKKCNYQCVLTGSKDYAVHHIYGFNLILKETYELLESKGMLRSKNIIDYSKEELGVIIEEFLKIHNSYPNGVCVRKDIHDLFHSIYGTGGNTEYQWNEFVNKYKNGGYR